jgi:hypothetical protein
MMDYNTYLINIFQCLRHVGFLATPPPRAYVYKAQVHGLIVENERIRRITASGQRELQPANMWLRKLSNCQEG